MSNLPLVPLLLLPGMMCDARMFAPQFHALANVAECHVGHIGGADNMYDIAQQVLAQAPERFALAGLSMGGIVAMEVIRQAPDRVTHLALLDTNPRAELDEIKEARGPQIAAAKAGDLEVVLREQMISRYFSEQQPHRILDQLCLDMGLDLGPDVFIRQSLALRDRPDQQDTLQQFNKPTLVLMGEDDQLCPLDRHERLCELLPHSHFVTITKAGHIPTLEQPAATNAALKQWLTQ